MATGDGAEQLNENLKKSREEANLLIDAMTSIGATLSVAIDDAIQGVKQIDNIGGKILQTYGRDINRSLKSINLGIDESVNLQQKFNRGQDISLELAKLREKQETKYNVLQSRAELLSTNLKGSSLKLTKEQKLELKSINQEIEETQKFEQKALEILEQQNNEREKSLGTLGKITGGVDGMLKNLDKSGNLSKIFNFDKALQETKKLNTELPGSTTLTSQIFKNMSSAASMTLLAGAAASKSLDLFKQWDEVTASTSRNIGLSKEAAGELNRELVSNTEFFGKGGVTLSGQLKSISAINAGLGGISLKFSGNNGLLEGASKLLNRLQISEDALSGLARQSMIAGKEIYDMAGSQADVMVGVEKEYGVRLSLRNVMEEANKTSGQLLLNTMNLPGGIVKAVSTAKSLGVEFKTISDSMKSLLDFESSITSELEAELLIGRDLNLEKARSYALQGDTVNAMKELVSQAGSLEAIQGMNVIAQEALANSLGFSVDQLSEMLLNQGAINTQLDKSIDRKGAEVLAAESMVSIQKQIAEAMENFNDMLKTSVSFALILGGIAAILLAIPTAGTSLGAFAIAAGGMGVVAGGAMAAKDYSNAAQTQDGIAPSSKGPFTIQDKFGATTITAKGDHLAVSPNLTVESSPIDEVKPQINITPVIKNEFPPQFYNSSQGKNPIPDDKEAKETNSLLKQILQKQGIIKMDATNVGTAFSVSTYQVQ